MEFPCKNEVTFKSLYQRGRTVYAPDIWSKDEIYAADVFQDIFFSIPEVLQEYIKDYELKVYCGLIKPNIVELPRIIIPPPSDPIIELEIM